MIDTYSFQLLNHLLLYSVRQGLIHHQNRLDRQKCLADRFRLRCTISDGFRLFFIQQATLVRLSEYAPQLLPSRIRRS